MRFTSGAMMISKVIATLDGQVIRTIETDVYVSRMSRILWEETFNAYDEYDVELHKREQGK